MLVWPLARFGRRRTDQVDRAGDTIAKYACMPAEVCLRAFETTMATGEGG